MRREVLDAAEALLAASGPDGLTVRALANEVVIGLMGVTLAR